MREIRDGWEMSVDVRVGSFPRWSRWLGALGIGLTLIAGVARAEDVIAARAGNADPTNPGEAFGWTNGGRSAFGKGVEAPEAAWKIVTEKGMPLCYWLEPSSDEVERAFQNGWRLVVRVRLDTEIVPFPSRFANTFGFESAEKNAEWMACLIIDEAEGLMVEINRNKFPLPGLSGSDYHIYEMTYDPGSQTVSLSVDGQSIAGNIKPVKADKTRIVWGNTSVTAASAAEWASVKMEVLRP